MGSRRPDDGARPDGSVDAAEADVAEQRRDLREDDLDPQAPAAARRGPSPTALDVGAADEADLAEQASEVDDDEDERG